MASPFISFPKPVQGSLWLRVADVVALCEGDLDGTTLIYVRGLNGPIVVNVPIASVLAQLA